jgi:hypothetical protein
MISSFRRVLYVVCNLSGLFSGVWCLIADVSEHYVFSIFIGKWNRTTHLTLTFMIGIYLHYLL